MARLNGWLGIGLGLVRFVKGAGPVTGNLYCFEDDQQYLFEDGVEFEFND